MLEYIETLEQEFWASANADIAAGQKAYMKNNFEFCGIKTPVRRKIQHVFLSKEHLPNKKDMEQIVKIMWNKPEREFQYFAQELLFKYSKFCEIGDIQLFEYLVTHKSWWDSIDFIAPKLMGHYFAIYPQERYANVARWLASDNIWLQRSAVLFQLNYKTELDTDFLEYVIAALLGSKDFFVNKAIGWILRNYSRVDAAWVLDYANRTNLHKLSKREAIRLIV